MNLVLIAVLLTGATSSLAQSKYLPTDHYIEQRDSSSETYGNAEAKTLKTDVVSIGNEKYLRIKGQEGILYLPYLSDLKKGDFTNGTCMTLHKDPVLRERVIQDYDAVLATNIRPKVELYAGFVVRTIKDKCSNRAETFYLPKNPGEIGISVRQDDTTYKVYNRVSPDTLRQKNSNDLVKPGVSLEKHF